MKCNGDCFNCSFDDCIVDRPQNKKDELKTTDKDKKKAEQRERKKEYMRRYYKEHKESYNRQMAIWRENHPNYNKDYWRKRKELAKV